MVLKGHSSCYYCIRTYEAQYFHRQQFAKRREFVKMLGRDIALLEKFKGDVQTFIDELGSGKNKSCAATTTRLMSAQMRQSKLQLPKAKFWPIKTYMREFGDSKAPENVKRKHRVTIFGQFQAWRKNSSDVCPLCVCLFVCVCVCVCVRACVCVFVQV